jgi:hypothetical protein
VVSGRITWKLGGWFAGTPAFRVMRCSFQAALSEKL